MAHIHSFAAFIKITFLMRSENGPPTARLFFYCCFAARPAGRQKKAGRAEKLRLAAAAALRSIQMQIQFVTTLFWNH